MGITLQEIAFYVVAAAIAVCSVLAVTTGKILRAATYLLFVLFGTGALYGILGYTFLGAVQLMVYAGGIVVLYVFSILLTQSDKDMKYKIRKAKLVSVLLTTLAGAALVLFSSSRCFRFYFKKSELSRCLQRISENNLLSPPCIVAYRPLIAAPPPRSARSARAPVPPSAHAECEMAPDCIFLLFAVPL